MAFEVASLDEVVRARDHLRKHDVPIHFEGRRRAGVQIAVEFRDPDGHKLEIYWGIDQIGSEAACVRPRNGRAPTAWKPRSPIRLSGRTPRCRTVAAAVCTRNVRRFAARVTCAW